MDTQACQQVSGAQGPSHKWEGSFVSLFPLSLTHPAVSPGMAEAWEELWHQDPQPLPSSGLGPPPCRRPPWGGNLQVSLAGSWERFGAQGGGPCLMSPFPLRVAQSSHQTTPWVHEGHRHQVGPPSCEEQCQGMTGPCGPRASGLECHRLPSPLPEAPSSPASVWPGCSHLETGGAWNWG